MKMKKSIKVSIIVILTALFFILNWLQDIYANFYEATNGIWYFNYNDLIALFHISWYLSMLIFLVVIIWLIHEVMEE